MSIDVRRALFALCVSVIWATITDNYTIITFAFIWSSGIGLAIALIPRKEEVTPTLTLMEHRMLVETNTRVQNIEAWIDTHESL